MFTLGSRWPKAGLGRRGKGGWVANNPNVLTFDVVCPGMDPFVARVVGPIGFGDGFLAIRQSTATQGSLTLVECTATNPILGTQTVFLTFIQRG